jgi:hypothetical protein
MDLLISAPHNPTAGVKAGRIYVVYGDAALSFPTLMLADADVRIAGEDANDEAGTSIEGDFDTDGDGTPDLLIGAPYNSGTAHESGRAYLLWGSGIGSEEVMTLSDADAMFTSDESDAFLGFSVTCAGDMDADGLDEVLIGIPQSSMSSRDAGAAAMYEASFLSTGGTFTTDDAEALFYGTSRNHLAGYAVLGLGDANGDTFPDIAIAEPDDASLASFSGAVRILFAP